MLTTNKARARKGKKSNLEAKVDNLTRLLKGQQHGLDSLTQLVREQQHGLNNQKHNLDEQKDDLKELKLAVL